MGPPANPVRFTRSCHTPTRAHVWNWIQARQRIRPKKPYKPVFYVEEWRCCQTNRKGLGTRPNPALFRPRRVQAMRPARREVDPWTEGLRSEIPGADECVFLFEVVVDRTMDCGELLQTTHAPEEKHRTFLSSARQHGSGVRADGLDHGRAPALVGALLAHVEARTTSVPGSRRSCGPPSGGRACIASAMAESTMVAIGCRTVVSW